MATDTDNSIISITDSCVQVTAGIGRVIARPAEGRENPSYEVLRKNNLVLSFPNSLPERPQDCFVSRIMPN